jgi:hypothetical protein
MSGEGNELAWDATIENDGGDGWTLLPAGEYQFRVVRFERTRHQPKPGGKLPACNCAKLTIEVGILGKYTTLEHKLYLHTSTEGFLCAFFKSIGQRQHGQRAIMDWGKVPGSTGRCRVKVRDWLGRNGEPRQSNEFAAFLEPPAGPAAAPAVQPAPPDGGPDDIPF